MEMYVFCVRSGKADFTQYINKNKITSTQNPCQIPCIYNNNYKIIVCNVNYTLS